MPLLAPDLPHRVEHRGIHGRKGQHRKLGVALGLPEAQFDPDRGVRIGPRGQRDEREGRLRPALLLHIGPGIDRLPVDAHLPQAGAARQNGTQEPPATRLHHHGHVRDDLAVAGDPAVGFHELDHLRHGVARVEPVHTHHEFERPVRVLVGRQRGRRAEEAKLGRQLERIELQE